VAGERLVTAAIDMAALADRLARIDVLLFDVDGVLTDGGLYLGPDGAEWKRFDIKDGAGIAQARARGLTTGVLSARHSAAATTRAAQLGMTPVVMGAHDKGAAFAALVAEQGWPLETIAYMGDDVLDLPVLRQVGLACCPADAVAAVREAVHWVSPCAGGHGAVRALIDLVLAARAPESSSSPSATIAT
jgi:3-deoxy-D-manno-octulosonate 8-phosphate phosphatase (KDO 8-P phosphatase)